MTKIWGSGVWTPDSAVHDDEALRIPLISQHPCACQSIGKHHQSVGSDARAGQGIMTKLDPTSIICRQQRFSRSWDMLAFLLHIIGELARMTFSGPVREAILVLCGCCESGHGCKMYVAVCMPVPSRLLPQAPSSFSANHGQTVHDLVWSRLIRVQGLVNANPGVRLAIDTSLDVSI